MCRVSKILIIIVVLLPMFRTGYAQVAGSLDSLAVKEAQLKENKSQTRGNETENSEISEGKRGINQNNDGTGNEDGKRSNENRDKKNGIKQVRSARPDMTRARGARPPQVIRQSGSGIPKGMGRPGGAGYHGGRK